VAGNTQSCGNLPETPFTYDGGQAAQVPLCVIVGLTFDAQGAMYIPEAFYESVLRVGGDGTIHRVVGSVTNGYLGDGGPPLAASLQGGDYYSPTSVALDGLGDIFLPQSAADRIREVMPGLVTAEFSVGRVGFQGAAPQSQTIQVLTNVAEPLPFVVGVETISGGAWLSANRVTGQTGDMLTLSANPAGLSAGVYTAAVQISVAGGATVGAALPVTLTVP
jgi:hypothetical protein